ncbi:MAG: cysteine protease [Candidatus Diapherotrites archaeon]
MIHKIDLRNIVSGFLVLLALFCFLIFAFLPSEPMGEGKLSYEMLTPEHIVSATYKIYSNEKLGQWVAKTIISNTGDRPLYNVKPQYNVAGYSDWSETQTYPMLLPGSTVVDLYYPILSSDLTNLTSPTPSKINVKFTYSKNKDGEEKELTGSKSVSILGVHDFIFSSIPPEESTGSFYDVASNYPLLAAWATPSDPVIMKFADAGNALAGGTAARLSDEDAIRSLEGMWTLSVANDIAYKTEPEAFWTGKFSQFIKYPRDVLKEKSGTCIDTALFFASLALSQGLDAYVILMPGHAFPVVRLPESGNIVIIESTQLNEHASFQTALEVGEQVFNNAMQGPNILVDIKSLQIAGITPPQLETLPENVFEQWNVKDTLTQTHSTSGGQSNTDGASDIVGENMRVYQNANPEWAITYPSDWVIHHAVEGEVLVQSPDTKSEFLVSWEPNETKENMRTYVEAALSTVGYVQSTSVSQENISNYYNGVVVTYNFQAFTGETGKGVGKYFEAGNYGFAFLYDTLNPNTQTAMNELEDIAVTFVVGA